MDAAVVAAIITGGLAFTASGTGLLYQARGQRLALRISTASSLAEARQDGNEAVLDAWKRIVDSQDRRITRLETAEHACREELSAVRKDLKEALHAERP